MHFLHLISAGAHCNTVYIRYCVWWHCQFRICTAGAFQLCASPAVCLQNQHTAEKIKQSKTYKKQVKDLNEQLALMKRKEAEKVKLEGLMRKSEEMITRLKSDVNRIKGQKAGIAKQMSELQQVFSAAVVHWYYVVWSSVCSLMWRVCPVFALSATHTNATVLGAMRFY